MRKGERMTERQKERLEQLKNINKEKQKEKEIWGNECFTECMQALGKQAIVFDNKISEKLYYKFAKLVPIENYQIVWEDFVWFQEIDDIDELIEICGNKRFYIIWGLDLPVVESNLNEILSSIYEIEVVSSDIWLFSEDFMFIQFYHEGDITIGKIR